MNNSMVMMEEVRESGVPSILETQLGSIAEEIQRLGRCKIDLGKTEREEEVRRATAARGAPPKVLPMSRTILIKQGEAEDKE